LFWFAAAGPKQRVGCLDFAQRGTSKAFLILEGKMSAFDELIEWIDEG
jgi:hypothetical protein